MAQSWPWVSQIAVKKKKKKKKKKKVNLLKGKPAKFAKNFSKSKSSNLDDPGISLSVFLPRTNLKPHNISITPRMVKKVITSLDSSKVSGPDCIPVVCLIGGPCI